MKILIVDDSSFSRSMIEQALRPLKVECIHAENGDQAWQILQEDKEIKLVTLDMILPDTNGINFLMKCRSLENIRYLDFVLVTSSKSDEMRVHAFEYGAANFLTKPFKAGALQEICRRLLFRDNQFAGCRILIADDSPTTRELIAKALQYFGIETIETDSAIDALNLFKSGEQIDLVITDMRMPGMTGTELVWKIRQMPKYSSIPIIMLSVNNTIENTLNFFKSGISDYLCKPFICEELQARVRVHLSSYLQRREADEHLQDLEELNRMKDELLAVCSHDIKAPLSVILGNTRLLLDIEDNEYKDYLEDINESGETMLSLVNSLLQTGRKEAKKEIKLTILKTQEILSKVIRQLNINASAKKILLKSNLVNAQIYGDETSFKRIFANLLSNAFKFTPENGRISLSSKKSKADLHIKLQDTGIGIPEDMLPQLFKKYTSSARNGTDGEESTGLGMSIVQDLVQKHKGQIEIKSEVGVGTIISLTFPLVSSSEDKSLDLTKCPILIADDQSASLRVLYKMLEKFGCKEITAVSDGQELVDTYQESLTENPFKLIITDIQMPGKTGEQAAQEIRQLDNEHRPYIIALSGFKEVYYNNSLFDEVLTKPLIPPQLKSCLNNIHSDDSHS